MRSAHLRPPEGNAMRFTRRRVAGVALLGATLILSAACDSDTDDSDSTPTTAATATATATASSTEGTPTGTPGEAAGGSIEPANPISPPEGTLASTSGEVDLGLGSYCWSPPEGVGAPAMCADAIGIITGTSDLTVEAGETLTIADEEPGTLPWPPMTIESATLWVAPDAPIASEADYRAWQPDAGFEGDTNLKADSSEVGSHTITLPDDLEPGRYLLSIFYTAGADRGSDATYGAILVVE